MEETWQASHLSYWLALSCIPAALLSQRQVHNLHPTSISIQQELQIIISQKVHGSSWVIVLLPAHKWKCTS